VAEAFLLVVLCYGLSSGQQRDAILRCAQRNARAGAAMLVHAFQNFAAGETEAQALLAWLDGVISSGAEKEPGWLLAFEAALPKQSVALRERAVRVTERLYTSLRAQVSGADDAGLQAELAGLANNLGVRLSQLGRRAEALGPAEEAVALYRKLAARNAEAFEPDLAMSLGMLGQVLEENERRDQACSRFGEGVQVLSRRFLDLPDAFAPLMVVLVREYLRLAEALGHEPDHALLAPVIEVLERVSKEGQS
jgi:tetratricopeptide (TPR) repeat protein